MTTIACWINREGGGKGKVRAWIVGDSRLSTLNQNRDSQKLVDGAIKIFRLPIVCKKPHPKGNHGTSEYSLGIGMVQFGRNNHDQDANSGTFFTDTYFSHSIGMAYAGSSILGTNLYLTLMTVTSNLSCIDEYVPSMYEIAVVAKDLAVKMCEEYSYNDMKAVGVEFCLIGFCKNKNNFQLIRVDIKKAFNSKVVVIFEDFSSEDDDFFLLLGDRKSEIYEEIKKVREKCEFKNINWWRAPSDVIRSLIEREDEGSIGGYLQAGLGHDKGFNLIGWIRPFSVNFLSTQVGIPVGKCFFNIPGLD